MTRSFHVQFYSARPVVAMPYSDYTSMLTFARRMGVSYIVADQSTIATRRPQLYGPLMDWDNPVGLKLVKTIYERDREVRIFELDPPAPPTDRKPYPLGYVSD